MWYLNTVNVLISDHAHMGFWFIIMHSTPIKADWVTPYFPNATHCWCVHLSHMLPTAIFELALVGVSICDRSPSNSYQATNSDCLLFLFFVMLPPSLCFRLSSTPLPLLSFLPRSFFSKVGFPHPLRQKYVSISSCVSCVCVCLSEGCKKPFALMCPGELWLNTTRLFIPLPLLPPLLPISPISCPQCCPLKPVTSLSTSLPLLLYSLVRACQFIVLIPQLRPSLPPLSLISLFLSPQLY